MSDITVEPKNINGAIVPPADKSISHRAIIIASLAQGKTKIYNLSDCDDCKQTLNAFRAMGVGICVDQGLVTIEGSGLRGLKRPETGRLFMGNSGTSMRLISAVLAAQDFSCELYGDQSLSKRPMARIIEPLSLMGAQISGKNAGQFAPLVIKGKSGLRAISYRMPVASAQVKSAILLAGLYASGVTKINEKIKSRDHTERMLKQFGADICVKGLSISLKASAALKARETVVPGDISAASFFLVAGCINPGSRIKAVSVGLNPTRAGVLAVLKKMGAKISCKYSQRAMLNKNFSAEPWGEVTAAYSQLKAVVIKAGEIPALIDELPVLMVAATQAAGKTVIKQAGELRFKETDRISAMVSGLSSLGAKIKVSGDDIIIQGPCALSGGLVDSFGDHRVAMSMAIAGLTAQGPVIIKDADCVNISFPGFFKQLRKVYV